MNASTVLRFSVMLSCATAVVALPSVGNADPNFGNLDLLVAEGETLLPDARLEIDYQSSVPSLVLSWPYVLQIAAWGADELHPDFVQFLDVSAEYQFQPAASASRGVGALRGGLLFGFGEQGLGGPILELGGLAGTDSHGLMAGAGIALGGDRDPDDSFAFGLELLYRHYLLEDGQRGEFALDFRFPHNLDADRSRGWDFWKEMVRLVSLIPDVWWEFADNEGNGVTLAFPFSAAVYTEDELVATISVEPQYRTRRHDVRGVLGTRAMWLPIAERGILVEAGGVLGTDGSGGMLGAGLVLFYDKASGGDASGTYTIAPVYRRSWTTGGTRDLVTLDFQFAWGD